MNKNSEEFLFAANMVKNLIMQPCEDEYSCLYGLYKQSTSGDNNKPKPLFINIMEVKKWESWEKYKGYCQYDAEVKYITLVNELIQKYGVNSQ